MSPTAMQWGSYARIAAVLRGRWNCFRLVPRCRLRRSCPASLASARNTVRRALGQLAEEGLVGTVPGRRRVVLGPGLPAATVPAYRRIAAVLQRAIAAGELAPGDTLPSEAALTRECGVSRGTARQALSFLASLGLVRAVHGKGRFVHAAASRNGG